MLKRKIRVTLALSTVMLGLSALAAAPASAIEPVDCGTRTDWLIVQTSDGGKNCFRLPGDRDENIRNVVRVSSGNNAGYIICSGARKGFSKWQSFSIIDGPGCTLTKIHVD
jgi:hypothetical protein